VPSRILEFDFRNAPLTPLNNILNIKTDAVVPVEGMKTASDLREQARRSNRKMWRARIPAKIARKRGDHAGEHMHSVKYLSVEVSSKLECKHGDYHIYSQGQEYLS
jgi:hypothetical protein